jgi:hypothetical protein
MPFIGKQPEVGAYSKLDAITTSATATYNLTLDSGAYYPTSANHLLVSLNGVMQAPQDSFTVSGSTIVFASTLASTDSIDFIMALGDVLDIGTPSDGTVTTAKIVDNSITSSKLAGALTTPSNLTVGGVLDATTATFDRASTDGVIVNLQKNNGSVGSIDVDNGDNLTVQGKSDHSGLQFGTNAIFPHKNSANIDATIDLGEGSLRWKDIYLSGGVYLGGTAAANKIDDYEEGTWTPVLYPSPSSVVYGTAAGTYTKVGNTVTCNWMLVLTNKGTLGASVRISGLPFTGLGAPSYQVATFMSSNLDLDANERLTGMQYSGNQFIYLMVEQNDAALYQPSGTGFLNNDSQIHGSITYMTAQ